MEKLFILVLVIPRSICNKMFFIKFVPLVFSFKESNHECNTCPSIKMYLVLSIMKRSWFIKLATLKKVRIFLLFWLGILHYEKKGILQLALQLIVYTVQFIATLSKQLIFNYYATPL
jgi:hypothetical protein